MKSLEAVTQHIGALLNMEQEPGGDQTIFSRTRTIKIGDGNESSTCLFDWDVSFENYQSNGGASNRSELYLRAEECEVFLHALIEGDHALLNDYHQGQKEKGGIVCFRMEAIEPP